MSTAPPVRIVLLLLLLFVVLPLLLLLMLLLLLSLLVLLLLLLLMLVVTEPPCSLVKWRPRKFAVAGMAHKRTTRIAIIYVFILGWLECG